MNAQQVIAESISNSENFIKKCKGTQVEDNKYLAVFPDTMMGVCMGFNGIEFGDTPYSYATALNYSRNVTNGHGQHPIIMTHQEYIDGCIRQQENYLDVLKNLQA